MRSIMKRSRQTPPTGIGRYVTPTDRNGKSAMVLCQVTSTSRAPHTIMKIAISAISSWTTRSSRVRNLVGEVGNAHVQVEPVTRGCADEGQHDGQENRERLGPRRRAVEHVAGKYRPWDNGRNQHQRGAADDDARKIEPVHRSAKQSGHFSIFLIAAERRRTLAPR